MGGGGGREGEARTQSHEGGGNGRGMGAQVIAGGEMWNREEGRGEDRGGDNALRGVGSRQRRIFCLDKDRCPRRGIAVWSEAGLGGRAGGGVRAVMPRRVDCGGFAGGPVRAGSRLSSCGLDRSSVAFAICARR